MLEHAQAFLHWTAAHPGWALGLLFAVAMLDAIFVIGAFVPASIVLFGVGALVALGSLELWPAALVAALGALAGDAFSYWLGWRYRERLFESRLLRRYPDVVARGRAFFDRHGGKGVWIARFLGPVRSITPALAGASGMPAWLFVVADFCAAYLWALIYILPGVLFGASMGLAAEVATRLAGLLLLGFGVGALAVWFTRLSMSGLQHYAARALGPMLDWSRRHRHLGRFGAALADPGQPETPVLAVVAATLALFGGFWLFLFADATRHPYPTPVDAFIYQALHDLQTPWGNAIALAIAQLGDPWVYGPVALAVLGALLARRKHRAAAHWVAALAFGGLISLGLHGVPILPAPANYFHGVDAAPLPRDLVMVMVIYGFLPVLMGTQRPARVRRRAYTASTILISLIVLARLYLGVEWWSLSLFSMLVALLWIGALGLGYRRHRPDRLFARSFLLPVAIVFAIAAGLRWWAEPPPPERETPGEQRLLAAEEWWTGAYAELPSQRVDLRGRATARFDLQWAGNLDAIRAALEADGWLPLTPLSGGNVLRWLTTSSSIDQLPVLPQVHAGSHPRLSLRRPIDTQRQVLIRLWPSGWQLDGGEPIWLGSLAPQTARTYYRLFRYPVTDRQAVVGFTPPRPYEQRLLAGEQGGLRLIAREPNLYTEPYREAPRGGRPRPVPAPPPAPLPQLVPAPCPSC